ncbi:MAG: protein-L-isoaspartate(D-aspartate) O-methyltransferase [Gammaproteobacteria bacterium]|nr:protein-L-isoaspartate(D-aspartate) O-methyltransferase [Gammaproteobacteria bacterium]MDH5803349.1 protein-L-isoaspartate(D-aspartate) O-methyltransferase [Gammaproteobacteria bacterium]
MSTNTRHRGIGMTSQRTRERLVKRLHQQGISHPEVLDVIRTLPRHIFVDEALASRSYEDTALPIGYSQTISQPYVVAKMTQELLESGPVNKVLEVGTGSGYQAAVLAKLVSQVFTVERIRPLLNAARQRFSELRLYNIKSDYSDGSWGWDEHAPFDAIIATAAPADIPQALLEQLVDGGRLIAPVGTAGSQELLLVTRSNSGFETRLLEKVSFVPMLEGIQ